MQNTEQTASNNTIYPRQIAFIAAFFLPMTKFLEVPSILAGKTEGDLLLPALLHFVLQFAILILLLWLASRSEKTLFERLESRLGKWIRVFYGIYAVYFVFASILPLFDLEKFVYAAFFDTAPTMFAFTFFFVLSAFICVKGIKALGRAADLSLFLFFIPFLSLIAMSLGEAKFSHLLPIFGVDFGHTMSAFKLTTPHFSDVILLLPLLGNCKVKKGDSAKILAGYGAGAGFTLIFLAVFFGIFSSLAPREHYAFSKIAQYFPALNVIGRIDLLFVYLLTIILLFVTCIPLQFATDFFCLSFNVKDKLLPAAVLNLALLLFLFYTNRHYDAIYSLFTTKLTFIFWIIADMVPLFLFFGAVFDTKKKSINQKGKEMKHV